MRNYKETAGDVAGYVLGGPLFWVVSAVTAAVMAVGFVTITTFERLFH